jgi:protein farnesyltransferase/geranylgeranyltransferase type-1 subunit alpha
MMSLSQFEDITPLELKSDEPQLCEILYDEEYQTVMGILLALMSQKEYSERALALTQKGIELLASHYTIWNYRYNLIVKLQKDLQEELEWCEQLALDNEKNYQIWNYRQLIIQQILSQGQPFNAAREYPIVDAMLLQDSKNHHVWSYRKWLVQTFDLFDDQREHTYICNAIEQDLLNNSAWTHRFFLIFGKEFKVDETVIDAEITYAKATIERVPQNASSWNYLIGVYGRSSERQIVELERFCSQFASLDEPVIRSSYALEALGQIYAEKGAIETAQKVYTSLMETYDPIRANYWQYRLQRLRETIR